MSNVSKLQARTETIKQFLTRGSFGELVGDVATNSLRNDPRRRDADLVVRQHGSKHGRYSVIRRLIDIKKRKFSRNDMKMKRPSEGRRGVKRNKNLPPAAEK